MREEKSLKKLQSLLTAVYALGVLGAVAYNFMIHDANGLFMTAVACLTPLIVPALFSLLHLKPVAEIEIISLVFCFFASLIGSGYHAYGLPFFDKILHFSSGLFLTVAAMLLFMVIKKSRTFKDPCDWPLFLVFINACNLAIAVLWEFFEYAMLIFFNNDCINHYTTGVHDSITDMLCAFTAGLLITVIMIRQHKSGKPNFITRLIDHFFELNFDQQNTDSPLAQGMKKDS